MDNGEKKLNLIFKKKAKRKKEIKVVKICEGSLQWILSLVNIERPIKISIGPIKDANNILHFGDKNIATTLICILLVSLQEKVWATIL